MTGHKHRLRYYIPLADLSSVNPNAYPTGILRARPIGPPENTDNP